MIDRYRTLARLLDAAEDGEVLVDGQVAILLVDERHKDGSASRAFMRFDRDELAEAADAAWRAPVVFHRFTMDAARPVVRHGISAITVTFTRDEDGHTRMTDAPQPQRRRRGDLAKPRSCSTGPLPTSHRCPTSMS